MKKIVLGILAVWLYSLPVCSAEVKIASPDGNYQMRVYDREGMIYYSVNYKNKPVILESLLGISSSRAGKAIEFAAVSENLVVNDWQDGMVIDSIAEKSVDAAWVPPYGERSLYADLYNGYAIDLRKTDNHKKRLQIHVRAYNEGGSMYSSVDEAAPYATPWRVIMAAENAAPDDMKSFRSMNPNTFRGKALAIVQPNGQAGEIRLTVSAEGLGEAAAIIQTESKLRIE